MSLLTHMQMVFNTFTTGVLVESADRKVEMVNERFLEIFELPVKPEDITGMDCEGSAAQCMHLFKEPEQFVADIEEIIQGGKPQKDQVAFADGKYFIRQYTPLFEDGELCGHVWNYEEVTTLKNKETELLEQKEFFHKVLNELPADIAIFSPQHRYIYLNKTAVKNDGIRKWMIGKDDYEYCEMRNLDRSVADERREKFNLAKESRASVSWVGEHPAADGGTNYVLRIFYPYINSNDDIEFVIGYGVNINQQKETELAVAREKERFSSLVNTLNDGVFQMTFSGEIQIHNQAFMKIMGLHMKHLPKQYNREVMRNVYVEDKAPLYIAFNTLQETKVPQTGTFRVLTDDGDTKFIEYYIWHSDVHKDGGVIAGRLSDVTERVQREHNMQRLITKEKELNNLKSHFIHITSHELRTPLSVIMSSAEILEMCAAEEDGDMATMIDTPSMTTGIVKEVNRITDILDELLMVGRIESGKIKFEPTTVNVRTYINSIVEELFMPYTDGRKLDVYVDKKVEDAFLDKSLVRHAVNNLVSNAFKYSPDSDAPELYVFEQDGCLQLQVRDHGIGIPHVEQEQLFTSFYRASNVGNISGTGIGLMVVEHVAKTHNGSIDVQSKQGEGSVFTLKLPLNKK